MEQINQRLGVDPREKVSAGVIVKAMILNGLGFVSAPLYLFEQFFNGKAIEALLGAGVTAEHLNDDRLGNVLDDLYKAGLSDVFLDSSLQACHQFGVAVETAHLDSTSFHVDGDYALKGEEAEPGTLHLTYGYSRDHRPDLKQFVLNLICAGDGDIPVFLELANGNQSDKARFADLFQDFKQQWTFDGLCVADGALYSRENLKTMSGLRWLTRVPLTVNAASTLVEQVLELKPTELKGYQYAEVLNEYGEVPQRWWLIESAERRRADLKKLTQKIEGIQAKGEMALKKLESQEFACLTDATDAANQFSLKLQWHQLSEIEIREKRHYDKAGKPRPSDVPNRISYQVSASLTAVESEITPQRVRCGRFILATNVLESEPLSVHQALREYKAQQGAERGFRFMKDPLFFASSVFLKSPKRIAALGLIMGFCLLVYNLGQRQLRQALEQQAQTIPNQLGKPTATPTLRWVFQCFMSIHLVVHQGVQQVVNLTAERLHILQFFSASCRRYYLLPIPGE